MNTYKIAIDTFLAETSECKASGCAVFTGADIAFQDIQLHTHRNKSELHFMAGHTMLSILLASILRAGTAGHPDHRVRGHHQRGRHHYP